jgi:putative peptide zinc metalloprotease protein
MNEQLPTWSGTPLDDRNLGSYLDPDTVVCLIGSPSDLKGIALIDQVNIERVQIGQPVRVLLDELHEQVLIGTVVEIARVEMLETPIELVAKQLLPSDTMASATSYYAVSIGLQRGQKSPLLWSSGKAKIAVKPLTLAEAIYRQLCGTFRIDL